MPSEFDLIRQYFKWPVDHTDLAGGDDAALLSPTLGHQLVVSTDMLVEGRHFLPGTDARDLGWKTLAVNVSDIAAMGAVPRWAFLSLALPTSDASWLDAFSSGMRDCATGFGVDLAGGDTTAGPLTINITILGEAPAGSAVTRSGAQAGDEVWVSGQPGRAALALWHLRDGLALNPAARDECLAALHRPQPRVALGLALRDVATAMLDVSDGLLGDLAHVLDASGTGVLLDESQFPLAPLSTACGDPALARRAFLAGGDDYELIFTAPAAQHDAVDAAARAAGVPAHRIGTITANRDERHLRTVSGTRSTLDMRGFDHFTTG